MTKLKVTGLKKNFGANEVLKGIDIEVKEGEVVCVIGPSGSGKSTFLRCMNNLEDITAGQVVVDDFNITDKKVDINKVGTYTVTLTATNEDGQAANPVEVSVIVSDAAAEKVNVKYVDEN
ncbi:ATP-binding cassette domain-containing protein, partial [Listeria booriae]|uniref:ATP-binding cassette domain-containing protein n=1 Tax=Listeria booriae TaxID=1552123 RepID=UPI001C89878E